MKRVALILNFDSCFYCPFHRGGDLLGQSLYCEYFEPPRIILNSNGSWVDCEFIHNIASFCPLPDNEIFNYGDMIVP